MSEMPIPGTIPVFDKADRLAKALQHSGVSVQQMADELGVTRNTVGNYINRRTPIPRASLKIWGLRTGVPWRWLETGEVPGDPDGWALWDSNPQPTDDRASVIDLFAPRLRAA